MSKRGYGQQSKGDNKDNDESTRGRPYQRGENDSVCSSYWRGDLPTTDTLKPNTDYENHDPAK
jgi:hypothetical protein